MTGRVPEFRIFSTTYVLTLFALFGRDSGCISGESKGKVKPYPPDYFFENGEPLGDHPLLFVILSFREPRTFEEVVSECFK
jgi:hypothetical protein